jgi:TDG/mug DNA glycosylase family protein
VSVDDHVLPDVLGPGLDLVFCGTAPGAASARAGAYYAGPGNAFWPTLHRVGLTPVRLLPVEFARLPKFGIGLTDIAKTASGSDAEVGRAGFDVARLEAAVAASGASILAFNGKNAAGGALGRVPGYGRQPETLGAAAVWVLPSTSGAARRFWDIGPWQDLARSTSQARKAGRRATAIGRTRAAAGRSRGGR